MKQLSQQLKDCQYSDSETESLLEAMDVPRKRLKTQVDRIDLLQQSALRNGENWWPMPLHQQGIRIHHGKALMTLPTTKATFMLVIDANS